MKRRQGHPARLTRDQRRRAAMDRYQQPDATEQNVQKLNGQMREALRRRGPDDGLIAGPLETAAHYATPALLDLFGLASDDEEPFREWLTYKLGQVATTELADVDGYLAWRRDCRDRAASVDRDEGTSSRMRELREKR